MDNSQTWTRMARNQRLLVRFIIFCAVGGSGVAVDSVILYLLADPHRMALGIGLSKICAAEIALVNNFLWNDLWTFKQPSDLPRNRIRRFLVFNAICGIGIAFGVVLLNLFHNVLGWNLYLSNLLVIALVTFWNFGMNAHFNWGVGKAAA